MIIHTIIDTRKVSLEIVRLFQEKIKIKQPVKIEFTRNPKTVKKRRR